jgi:hypothetical protein
MLLLLLLLLPLSTSTLPAAMEAAIDNGQDHVADVLKYHALQRDMSTFRQEHLLKARECRSNDVASTDAACQGRD